MKYDALDASGRRSLVQLCANRITGALIYAIPSNFAILSVGFILIEQNKGLMFNV